MSDLNSTPATNSRRSLILGVVAAVLAAAGGAAWWSVARDDQARPEPGSSLSSQTSSASRTPNSGSTSRPTSSASTTSTPAPSKRPTRTPQPSSTATENTLPEQSPVSLDSEAVRPDGVVIRLGKIESVTGEAKLPGEVAGPALRISVVITNGADGPLDLDSVVVNGYRGSDRVPLESLTSPGGNPFRGNLKPKTDATGAYVFAVDPKFRSDVTFTVDATPGEPAAVFRGDAR